ncbi:MAG: hypothetical protein EBT98_11605 [Opitutaceae bacterium]|jgi:hypothetical protein|nr:hypothetical protein [Opitutaceae bacterium]NBR59427.1 hypothetical protein [Opitutaceae bacterium]
MKYLVSTLALIVLGAVALGLICYRLSCDPALHVAAEKGDAWHWLRQDFHLTEQQFAAIQVVHQTYAGSCVEHCRLIQEATKVRDALTAKISSPADRVAAETAVKELRSVCEQALTGHVKKVAALMSVEDGRRYLALMLPKIAAFDHATAPDLQMNHAH